MTRECVTPECDLQARGLWGPGTGGPPVIFGMGFLPFPYEPQPESVSQCALKSLLKPLRFSYDMWMFGT